MRIAPFIFALATAVVLHATDARVDFSSDRDVRVLSEVKHFAFDFVALSGRTQGEMALARILKREDAIRPLIEVYDRGTTEAKVYALAAFHLLAPQLFEECRRDLVGKYNPSLRRFAPSFISRARFRESVVLAAFRSRRRQVHTA